MAFLGHLFDGGAFDPNSVEPSEPFDILPPGKYPAQIVKSDMVPTKAGTGEMLKLEFEIIDGPSKGRKLWSNLNLANPNPQAVEIARKDFSAICRSIGKASVSESDQLHFQPMMLTVKVVPAGPDKHGIHREAKNEIGGYAALGGAQPAPAARPVQSQPTQQQPRQAPAQAAQAAPAARPAAAATPPWRRSA